MNSPRVNFSKHSKKTRPGTTTTIGIDFGTSNCCIATYVSGKLKIHLSPRNEKVTSSIVAVRNGRIIVGEEAREEPGVIPDIKRIIGLSNNHNMIKSYSEDWQVKVENTDNENTVMLVGERFTAEEIVALLFRYLTQNLNPAGRVVITVPRSFGMVERQAMKNAAAIAGFRVVSVIPETEAAAIAFAAKTRNVNESEHTLIFQLGGSTIDVAIFKISKSQVTLLGSAASSSLGGNEFDSNLLKNVLEESRKKVDDQLRTKLRRACKSAKEKLRTAQSTRICLEESDISVEITRNQLNIINQDLLKVINIMIDMAMKAAELDKSQMHKYILIGRGCPMKSIEENMEVMLGANKRSECLDMNEAAVMGAAMYGCSEVCCSITETISVTIADGKVTHRDTCVEKRAASLLENYLDDLQQVTSVKSNMSITVRGFNKTVESELSKSRKKVDDLFTEDKKTQDLEKRAAAIEAEATKLKRRSKNKEIQNKCEQMVVEWYRKHEGKFTENELSQKENTLSSMQRAPQQDDNKMAIKVSGQPEKSGILSRIRSSLCSKNTPPTSMQDINTSQQSPKKTREIDGGQPAPSSELSQIQREEVNPPSVTDSGQPALPGQPSQ